MQTVVGCRVVQRGESNASTYDGCAFHRVDTERGDQSLGGEHDRVARPVGSGGADQAGVGSLRKKANPFTHGPPHDIAHFIERTRPYDRSGLARLAPPWLLVGAKVGDEQAGKLLERHWCSLSRCDSTPVYQSTNCITPSSSKSEYGPGL